MLAEQQGEPKVGDNEVKRWQGAIFPKGDSLRNLYNTGILTYPEYSQVDKLNTLLCAGCIDREDYLNQLGNLKEKLTPYVDYDENTETESVADKLVNLMQLLEEGEITQEEYDKMSAVINRQVVENGQMWS